MYPGWITPASCFEQPFHDMYIFGDSYSDNGQPLKSSNYQTHTFTDRHSNGPMCAEYFAKMMGSNLYNYAYSGATVDNSILPRSTLDLHQQLQTFEKKGGPVNPPDSTLYAIWIGTNDVLDTFKLQTSGAMRYQTLLHTLASFYAGLETLYHMGPVKHLLIIGLLPVDHMPVISSLITHESQRRPMTELVTSYNKGLEQLAQRFRQEHPGANVYYYDPQPLAARLFNSQSSFDVATPCLVQKNFCPDENRRLWWDDYHPTTVASYMVAKDLYQWMFHA
ncbi:hypothetical protein [Absidia glauca]|uniref:SGNH hydrolase-type esterase domain-containing protein n=1 Tax=Absidia glauca TaxID=4829 RepID=A0A168P0F9_ABSGL|nr:hypothetical protein [Absidia glauca]